MTDPRPAHARRRAALAVIVIASCGGPARPTPAPVAAPAAAEAVDDGQAMAAYEAGHFAECARLFGLLAERSPRMIRRDKTYNQASCLARDGRADEAFAALGRAIDDGLTITTEHFAADTDLAVLHADARWPGVVAALEAARERRVAAIGDRALHDDLLARMETDQAAVMKAYVNADTKGDPTAVAAAQATNQENTAWMKGVVRDRGWPTHAMVGEDGAHAAWLLVQHADTEPAFQAECLAKMQPLLASEETSEVDYAYLYDRVAVAEHRPQRYGTQFDEQRQPRPIEDPEHVDERRVRIGLPTMAAYTKMMIEMYGPPPAATTP